MAVEITKAADYEQLCTECGVCLQSDREQCPECGTPRPEEGWRPLRHAAHPYLGRLLDGRYLLDRHLGGGTSGSVYRAHDQKLDRPFALKILRLGEEADDADEKLRRFDKEVEALSRIRNPHVINIYESLRLGSQTPAMLTEYIAGSTLREMIEGAKHLDVDSALALIHQIANGLHEAHAQGVIHRDLKPANVMVEKLPATGSFARILDFGLVHIAEDGGQTQGFWGTPLYAAPEQCGGDGEITSATDIYSLGCVLFRCLAGRPVFERESARSLMLAQYQEPAPRLARVAPQPIPPELDNLVDAMLSKAPEDRPEDMARVIEAIDRLSDDERRWSESVVVGEMPEEPSVDPEEAGASAEQLPDDPGARTATGTRLGVADTEGAAPRLAQLLHRTDLASALGSGTAIRSARFDASGDCAVLVDSNHRLHVMSTEGADFFQTLRPAEVTIGAVAPDISAGRIFGAEQNGGLLRWRLEAPEKPPERLEELGARVFALALGERGRKLYVGTEDGEILCRDLRIGATERVCRLASAVCELDLGPRGRWLVGATLDRQVSVYDREGEGGVERLGTLRARPVGVEAMPALGTVAALDLEGRLQVLGLQGETEPTAVEPSIEEIRAILFTDDRQMFALSLLEPRVRIWRIRHELFREAFQPRGPSGTRIRAPARDA